MSYQETVEWMFQQLPMYQRIGKQAFKKDLKNTQALAAHLGHPERKFKSVHVAGTNGKGSVSNMLASIFQEAGYKTGLYTSPHLKDFRERIRINGNMISEEKVVEFVQKNRDFLLSQKLSFFEMTVGMAFDHFSEEDVDIAIIEVGMGGRLDSTNIIMPELSIITNIGFDHTAFLGNSLDLIAAEKAGIIKFGIPVVIGEKQMETTSVFEKFAEDQNSLLTYAEDVEIPEYKSDLSGLYQKKNIRTVLSAVQQLRKNYWELTEEAVQAGLQQVRKNTGLRGRWDILQKRPLIICDTAHNKEGLQWVIKQILEQNFNRLHLVLGVVNDKDLDSVLPLFPKSAYYYFSKPDVPRGLDASILQEKAVEFGLSGEVFHSIPEALEKAKMRAQEDDLIFAGGSNFTVAEII